MSSLPRAASVGAALTAPPVSVNDPRAIPAGRRPRGAAPGASWRPASERRLGALSASSMSAVTTAPCPGCRGRLARLSAMASSRRIRPATASLVIGGRPAGRAPRGWPACAPAAAGRPRRRWSGHLLAEDLQRALDPGAGRHRRPRRAAQVGVVEVGQPVGGRAHLAAHPALLPGQHRVVGAEAGQQAPIASPSRTTTRSTPRTSRALAAMPSRRAAPTSASAASGPGQVISRAEDRPGSVERPVGEERAAPGGLGVADRPPTTPAAAARARAGRARRSARSGGPAPRRPGRRARRSGCPGAARRRRARGSRWRARRRRRCPCAAARAAAPVSSSASTTIRPPTMCSPPAKRSSAATSALRQQGLVTVEPAELVLDRCGHRHTGHPVIRLRLGPPSGRLPLVAPSAPEGYVDQQPGSSGPSADDVTVCRGKPQRVVVARTSSPRRAKDQARAHVLGYPPQRHLVLDDVGVGEHHVQLKLGGMRSQDLEVVSGEKPTVSPVCITRLSTRTRLARRVDERIMDPGHQQCGMTEVNQEPGPRITQSAAWMASRPGHMRAARRGRAAPTAPCPVVVATSDLATTVGISNGRPGSAPMTLASMLSGTAAIGSTRPRALSN